MNDLFEFCESFSPLGRRLIANQFKVMNGVPKSRSIRSTPDGTWDRLRGASPMVTEFQ